MKTLDTFLFGLYPYICLSVFPARQPDPLRSRPVAPWKSDSSQPLHRSIALGQQTCSTSASCSCSSDIFGMLTPHAVHEPFITTGSKQVLAMTAGGIAGTLDFHRRDDLLHRRLTEPRIRATSSPATS